MIEASLLLAHKTIKTVAPLLHLTANVKGADDDMLYTGRLLYLADKHHLLYYGRTITRDEHIRIQGGPIGELAFEVSDTWKVSLSGFYRSKLPPEKAGEYLSESDEGSLAFVIEKFAAMPRGKFYGYIRSLPEWKKVEDLFQLKDEEDRYRIRRLPMDRLDMLLLPDGDHYFNVSAEHVAETRRFMTGEFD